MRREFVVDKLYRDSTHSKISGVCGGLAKHWNVPRSVVRVAAVVCLIAMPSVAIVAYITATILIPNR